MVAFLKTASLLLYDEVFAPVARIEAIRLFLAYASFMGFTVYQMDVKSAFLYGTIDEEVYVMQPPRFHDPEYPTRVYKVEKAMGTIDQTLFIRRQREDFILVQVYVDDIIFGSSNPQLCRAFEALMHEKFQMSAMGELNFFLGLQVLQKEDGIFLSQDKYIGDILKKFGFSDGEHNTDFHPMVDFLEASPLRYALTVKPTVYVSHLRQFWSTARIETSEEGTKILATIDGIVRTIFESSLRRNLKLRDEEGISSLPDAELFENLTLMGYNISPNQKLTFQKGQFSHQENSIPTFIPWWISLQHLLSDEGTHILATVDGIQRTVSEASLRRNLKLRDEDGIVSIPDTELFENLTLMGYNISPNQKFTFQKGQFSHQWKYLIHTIMQCLSPKSTRFNEFSSNITTALVCLATNRTYNFSKMIFDGMVKNVNNKVSKFLMKYTRRTRIAQSSVLPPIADEPASPLGDDSQGEACPTDSGFEVDQDRANIAKTSTLPSHSTPMVTSLAANEGSMQQKLNELTALCTSLQRQQSEMVSRFEAQELEINSLKAIIKLLEDKDRWVAEQSRDDAPIKGEFARELEEQMAREDQRMSEQIARDAEVARIHAEKEL
nr:putative ribonuclease H-like domain-containing protein [Tanacetum cinerariifolium]